MGNSLQQQLDSLVTSSVSSIGDDIPWSKQFTMLDKQPLNNTYILHHIPTNSSYKVKHLTLNKSQHQEIFRQIDIKKNTPSPFVTKLQKTQQYTVKGYCSEHEEVFLMYKYVETNLKEEILNRRFKQEKFMQEEIRVILESGVKGISYLHGIGCTPKGLNTSEILLTQDRAVLVNDPWLGVGSPLAHTGQQQQHSASHNTKNQLTNEQQQGSRIYSIPVQDYPSPQKLLYMNELIQQYNEWLSQLFTFGMIVMQTIFMSSLNEQMYDKGKRKIYYHRVKEKVEEIEEGVQLERSNDSNKGQSMVLSEIKQDLRRLLSHEPKIRQSVWLKYKKSHNNSSILTLTKRESNEFKLNKENNINQSEDKQKKSNNNRGSKYFSTIQQNNLNNKQALSTTAIRRKQNWVLNSINQQHHEEWLKLSKEKQTQNNRFRVVSSSLPQSNNRTVLQSGELNSFIKKKNDGLGYRQLGGGQANSLISNINNNIANNNSQQQKKFHQQEQQQSHYLSEYRQNNFLPRTGTTIIQQKHQLSSTTTSPSLLVNTNKSLRKNNYPDNSNMYKGYGDYLGGNKYSGNSINQMYTGSNSSGNQYSLPFHELHSVKLRTGELSPKKETLVQKQNNNYGSYNNYNSNNNNYSDNYSNKLFPSYNKAQTPTTTTIPSSAYLSSTISTNPYNLSQISPIIGGQDYSYSGSYNNNSYLHKYDSNGSNLLNGGNILNNLPANMVTRSSSSYVLQGNNANSSNSNTNNPILNTAYSHIKPTYLQYKPSTWTYDSMVNFNNSKETSTIKNSYQNNNNNTDNTTTPQTYSSYQLFKLNFFNNHTNHIDNNNNNNNTNSINNSPSTNQQKNPTSTTTNNQTTTTLNPSTIPKMPSYKQLNNFHFREVGSLYEGDSHFSNDKESIVIQSYSGGIGAGKYTSGGLSSVGGLYKGEVGVNALGVSGNTYMRPTISPKDSFEINHSIINNTRNDGKSFSSMDEDVKQLRKFGQQQHPFDKKPNSSYSSSQKVSLIDKIYDPQVLGSFQRKSLENNVSMGKDYFGSVLGAHYASDRNDHHQQNDNSHNSNRSSENLHSNRQDKNTHTRNSSQNYLQTPQRYPTKYKHNNTIRQASCEDSGVNMSNGGDSYDHEKIYPNTEISKYQMNEERRYSLRKVDGEDDSLIEKDGFKTERGRQRDRDREIRVDQDHDDRIENNEKNVEGGQKPQENNQGQRVTLYADGSRYVGSTDQKGQSHGHGILYYPDGHIAYEGSWQHGDFNGQGHLFNPYELAMQKSFDYRDLTKMDEYIKEFEGMFNHDVKEGMGALKMHNNEVYEGEFANDLPNGRGKFSCSDGNVVEGVWERGYLQKTY